LGKVPVGTKIKPAPPDLSAAATARGKVKLGADGKLVRDHRSAAGMTGNATADIKGKAVGKLDVQAPAVGVPAVAVDVKGKVGGAGNATADVKSKVGGAMKASAPAAGANAGANVNASANATVKAPEVKVKAPDVKVEGKAKGSFKLGN
jgi:hypothetical protein